MMKKFATGFLAAALSLGLAACTEEEAAVGEAEDLNQLESPAAGEQPLADPAYDPGIGQEEGLIEEDEGLIDQEEGLGAEEPMGTEDQLIEEEFDPQANQ